MTSRRDLLAAGVLLALSACGGSGSSPTAPAPTPSTPPAPTPAPPAPPVIPPSIAGDWAVDAPANQGVTQALMNQLLQDAGAVPNVRGVVVVRNGRLIGERYYNGFGMSDLQHVRSITKSVSSLMLGMALNDGLVPNVSATLASLLPEAFAANPGSQLASLALSDILTMRSGVGFNDDTQWDQLIGAPDSVRFVLGLPVSGLHNFHYDSAGSHLPSAIVQRVRALAFDTVTKRDLLEPLGITQLAWTRDALGVPYGSFGMQMRTRDTAKLGQLVLDNGKWGGQQLVPAAWIADSTATKVTLSGQGVMGSPGYGYLWWTGTLGGKPIVLGWGFAGQFCVIVRSLNMVIQTNTFHSVSGAAQTVQEQGLLQAISSFLSNL
jgi:CubicO group peptidase (beta-lactamase class C family)